MTASERIDLMIEDLTDWRGKTLSRLRALIKQADPEAIEEWLSGEEYGVCFGHPRHDQ